MEKQAVSADVAELEFTPGIPLAYMSDVSRRVRVILNS